MKFTALEEYGLRCILQMARRYDEQKNITISTIAEDEGISIPYVGKLMGLLRDGDLVESVRGKLGGYRLVRSPDKISVAEVLYKIEGNFFGEGTCKQYTGINCDCIHHSDCSMRSLWRYIDRTLEQSLNKLMVSELLASESVCNEKFSLNDKKVKER